MSNTFDENSPFVSRLVARTHSAAEIASDTLALRLMTYSDAEKMSLYYQKNAEHFRPWVPRTPPDYHSEKAWLQRIGDCMAQQKARNACYFVALKGQTVVAHCSLSQIFYGPFCACYMGYGIDEDAQGQGIMFALCEYVIEYAFEQLDLHRIMANYMPHNNRSAKLLKRLGFRMEGKACDYLKINGRWEDHVLTSLTRKAAS